MAESLSGKCAVITGAGSGIGRAIALAFAAEGASVVVLDITQQPLEGGEPTTQLIASAGGSAAFEKVDVSSWGELDGAITRAVERYGRLDIMVNNAAIFSGTSLLESSEADWERVMGVNMTGMFYGCKRAVQQMLTQEPRHEVRGRLINLGSQQGIVNSPRDTAYGVSKAGAIYLKADWTKPDPEIERALAAEGRAGVPLYLVYGKDGGAPQVLPQLLSQGAVVAAIRKAAAAGA